MTVVALGSVKGAPGTTTAALALAGAWPSDRPVVLIEADPDGGVLAARTGLAPDPGLVTLAAGARRAEAPLDLHAHTQALPGSLPVVVAPPGPEQTAAALATLTPLLAREAPPVDVVIDCGRLAPGSPALPLASAADVLLVVCRPELDQLHVLAHRLPSLRAVQPAPGLLVVGDRPYRPEEAAAALGVDLAGWLPVDRFGAGVLGGAPAHGRRWRRAPLLRAASSLAAVVADRAEKPEEVLT